jgi:hypothetical protein
MSEPEKLGPFIHFPACVEMSQLLLIEAGMFIANPNLVRFFRKITTAERKEGYNHSHCLVTFCADGVTHRYCDVVSNESSR